MAGRSEPRWRLGASFLGGILLVAILGGAVRPRQNDLAHTTGMLTEFGSKLVPQRARIDYCRLVHAPLFRYGFLAAFIVLPLLGLGSICCSYCTFSVIPGAIGAIFAPGERALLAAGSHLVTLVLFGGLLGVLARDGRGHCHLTCPVGALDSLVNAIGARRSFAWRVRVRPERCNGCGLCMAACPAAALSLDRENRLAHIDYHRCNQCRLCEASCRRAAIGYGRLKVRRTREAAPQPREADG